MTEPPAALGDPLVVFTDTATCDGRQHEVHLITDGTTAYAYAAGVDLALIRREPDNTRVVVSCRVPDAGDEECYGEAVFNLDTPCWSHAGDGLAATLLARLGEVMDR